METNRANQNSAESAEDKNQDLNANSAYSGSGTMQPGGGTGEAGKLSDYPDGNLDDVQQQTESIPGNQTDQPDTENRSIDESTDPSKLSRH